MVTATIILKKLTVIEAVQSYLMTTLLADDTNHGALLLLLAIFKFYTFNFNSQKH